MKKNLILTAALACSLTLAAGFSCPAFAESVAETAEEAAADTASNPEEMIFTADEAPVSEQELTVDNIDEFISLADYKNREISAGSDTPIENGMTANIDYTGTIDGEVFDGGSAQGANLEIGSGTFIEGFEEQLVGCREGDRVTVSVTFPSDYFAEELAGKAAEFDVSINRVYLNTPSVILSQITDESELIQYPQSLCDEWDRILREIYAGYMGGEEDFSKVLEAFGISEDTFRSMVLTNVKGDLVQRAILAKEGLSKESEAYEKSLAVLLGTYGFDSIENMKAVGYADAEIEYVVMNRMCLGVIEQYGA